MPMNEVTDFTRLSASKIFVSESDTEAVSVIELPVARWISTAKLSRSALGSIWTLIWVRKNKPMATEMTDAMMVLHL